MSTYIYMDPKESRQTSALVLEQGPEYHLCVRNLRSSPAREQGGQSSGQLCYFPFSHLLLNNVCIVRLEVFLLWYYASQIFRYLVP